MDSRHTGRQRADMTLAIAAGPRYWRDRQPSPTDIAAAALQVVALAAIVSIALFSGTALTPTNGGRWSDWSLAGVLLLGAVILGRPSLLLLADPTSRAASAPLGGIWGVALARATTVTAFLVVWVTDMRGVSLTVAWLVGVVGGCEAAMTLWALGVALEPRSMWRGFVTSSVHIGVVGGLGFELLLTRGSDHWWTVLALYLSVHIALVAAVTTIWIVESIRRAVRTSTDEAVNTDRATSARDRAHWLHDDVCSELRLVQVQLETGRIAPHDVADALRALDDQLRVRQLDEVLESGSVRLAEIIQPYVRRAQNAGTIVTDVPRFAEAALVLDARRGRMLQRGTAIFVTNAVQAGAAHLAIRVRVDALAGELVLEIEDDAGGFDIDATPSGRGLDNLRHQIGDDTVRLERTSHGTRAVLVIRDLQESAHDPASVA
jgi:signal transduction histidine kinase